MLLDLHVHSTYSDGKLTPKQILKVAKGLGLSGVAITDHDAVKGSLEGLRVAEEIVVIPGSEISAKEGHILALWIKEEVPKGLPAEETVERIHELGGLAVAAHPYDVLRSSLGKEILSLPFDAVEAANGRTLLRLRNPRFVSRHKPKLPLIGGSDAHFDWEIGRVCTRLEDPESLKGAEVVDNRGRFDKLFYILRRVSSIFK